MRENSSDFSKKYEQVINSSKANSFQYIYEIVLHSGVVLHLDSHLSIVNGEFNDSAENIIILNGIFGIGGITRDMNLAGCMIKISYSIDGILSPLITYFITEFEKNDLDFNIKCQPETTKYNQSLLLSFSKTCRANFGDNKCGIDLNNYKTIYKIESINLRSIILSEIGLANGYYNLGYVWFESQSKRIFSFKIISHNNNKIELEETVPDEFLEQEYASLTPNCDKNFITCCNKFNNAVNFRGEPTIAEHNFLKNDV